MASLFNVPNKTILFALGNHAPGEVAFCEEEQEYMIYENDEWKHTEFEKTPQDIQIPVYEVNKQIYAQLPPMNIDKEIKASLNKYIEGTSDYWLLYGKHIGYFTLFKYKHDYEEDFSEVFFDCLSNVAKEIKDIEFLEDGAVEIWLTTPEDETTVLYLFDYSNGVVYYG